MKRTVVSLLVLVLMIGGIPVGADGGTPTPQPGEESLADVCRAAVDGIAELKSELDFPEHLEAENAVKTEDDFDVNDYFTVLDHLKVEEGYILDYVYQFDGMGGYPVLYVREEGEAAFETFADYSAERDRETDNYLEHIVADGTPEGYIQLAILSVIGDQFYLFWHANYHDAQFICDQEKLETLVGSKTMFDDMLPDDVQRAALKLDVTPDVQIGKDGALVKLVAFTNWGGFYRWTFAFGPGKTPGVMEQEVLVEYQCGVMF